MNVLHNYFNSLTKLFLDSKIIFRLYLAKFLNTLAKLFFS